MAGESRGSRRTYGRHAAPGFGSALGYTVLGALLPGTAFLASGRRRLGAVVLTVFLLLLAGGVWLATAGRGEAIRLAVDSTALVVAIGGVVLLALAWLVVVVGGYRAVLPRGARGWQHALGVLVVLLLCAGVVAPAAKVVQIASAQRDLVDTVFADEDSATVTAPVDESRPFGDKEEVNILLLGGDGGSDREGVRTDTVIVANVQTDTGATTLFSLPRNLEDLPFPADSPLAAVYPDGFDAGSESESLLNAVYRNGPAAHPDILGPTADPGADFLKLGVGEALGLHIDYYVLVNLDGFSRLVDALGGITVNVNYYVPIGGEPTLGTLPDDYIAPGPDQRMDGPTALAYSRGRFGLTDYQRMDRQRCVLNAIVKAANPVTLLTRFQELAATTQDIVSTDVPQDLLGDVVDVAMKVKDNAIRSVVFDDTVIRPAYPDYGLIRTLVQQALAPATDTGSTASAPAPSSSSAAPAPPAPSTPAGNTAAGSADTVTDACAYDPVQAQAALAAGEPPTR
ncbi:LytR family transcriptional regulator [Modestobacter versicolor]|uniref:LytR family transcriptional regulator n=1 Tax=Modestobacter versicolor TaxID=429133 RepID=A0A323V7X5_9ACTN|nr:LCP family protein [Modestobacter versicolor]PZA20872.1 LytR family transcriptional regulator [Modestobacter versicolor]